MNRIQKTFKQGKAFVGYLTAGDGGIQTTLEAALALIEGGVNMLEIGVPFSDPIADGPVIQRAAYRAIKQGTTLKDIVWLTERIREKSSIPLILFSYYNPLFAVAHTSFLHDITQAGIDGLLIVDCPIEESKQWHAACKQHAIAPVYVITPTTPIDRMAKIDKAGEGFLYYACRKGTTGMRDALPLDFANKIHEIKSHTHLPVVVGFGISNRTMAEEVIKSADGVVVGSLFVKRLEEGGNPSDLTLLAKSLCPI